MKYGQTKKYFWWYFSIFLGFSVVIVFWSFLNLSHISFAQSANNQEITDNSNSGLDTISVRVIANPENLSAKMWFQEQGLSGFLEELFVDNYKAVRSGQTVYVQAANTNGDYFYTNIYQLSYSQNVAPKTRVVFDRLIDNWRFNSNLSGIGTCEIAKFSCTTNDDCPDSFICSTTNSCQLKNKIFCQSDSDCPENIFCNSDKAEAVRHTRALGDISEIRDAMRKYFDEFGHLPSITSRRYMSPGMVFSNWPGWQSLLARELKIDKLPEHPINSFGYCGELHDRNLCWNRSRHTLGPGEVYINERVSVPAETYLYAYIDGKIYIINNNEVTSFDLMDGI